MFMELEIFKKKNNGISTITIKIEEGCQPFLEKIFILFLKYSITILNEKKNHPNFSKKFQISDNHYYYAYHHISDNSSCTACREIQNLTL